MKYILVVLGILIFLLANFYVFQRIWRVMPVTTIGRILLVVTAIILVSSIFIYFIFKDSLPIWLNTIFYTIGSSWLCIFLYLLLFNFIQDIACFTGIVPKQIVLKYTKDNWAGLALIIGFVVMLMFAGYMKYRIKERVAIDITLNKDLGKDSLKIVALSDLHLGYTIGDKELAEWVDLINSENPDIILIAGDIIDNDVRPLRSGRFSDYLKEIKAPLGVYTCVGNHEYISDIEESKAFIQETGIIILQDSSVLVNDNFYVVGRDDRSNTNRKSLDELVKDLDKSKPIIVLDHQPYRLEEVDKNHIDLQLSGHTHNGQIWPISLITSWIYEKSHGYLQKGNSHIYVSSGIGIWGGKFRIGTQSEYVVLTMKN